MKHLGDITKIKGNEVPSVDIICGGSPCQDLSVAGKRAGLAGERSGLFMEQIRIIKEMRERSKQNGATNDDIRPRYMVWENVPGAFSSNKGEDFRAVLEETAKVVKEDAVIPKLEGGQKWTSSGCIMGDGWSIAWRVHDAQFWGVPQRRKRISLVADFGGETAPEILFERESVSGNTEQSEQKGQETSGTVRESLNYTEYGGAGSVAYVQGTTRESETNMLTKENSSSKTYDVRISSDGANPDSNHGGVAIVEEPILLESNQNHATVQTNGVSTTLSASMGQGGGYVPMVVDSVKCYDMENERRRNLIETEELSPTLSARAGTGGNNVPCIIDTEVKCIGNGQTDSLREQDKAGTLNCMHDQQAIVVYGFNRERVGAVVAEEKMPTLQAAAGESGNNQPMVCYGVDCYNQSATEEITMPIRSKSADTDHIPCVSLETFHCQTEEELTQTLKARDYKDPQVVTYAIDRAAFNQGQNAMYDISVQEERAQTLVSRGPGAVMSEKNVCHSVVRRLTPKECERLQAYPDDWTNIGEWVDSSGKKHKDADSPRYKALGNSIALPFWQWMAERMISNYNRPTEMASLFDGIGGFPLVFSRVGCKPVWASEIEEFPIAVTKIRFPEVEE